jgi:hypothetical protein
MLSLVSQVKCKNCGPFLKRLQETGSTVFCFVQLLWRFTGQLIRWVNHRTVKLRLRRVTQEPSQQSADGEPSVCCHRLFKSLEFGFSAVNLRLVQAPTYYLRRDVVALQPFDYEMEKQQLEAQFKEYKATHQPQASSSSSSAGSSGSITTLGHLPWLTAFALTYCT